MEIDSIKPPPKVAVCLAAFNGLHWIAEQLDSILAQAYVDVTVFISVDQSTDGTEKWIDQRAVGDKRIIVLPHGQRFGGAARNFFRLLRDVDFSGFDYISFADQDDLWFTDKLKRAHEMLQRTGADGYSSNVTAFWSGGRELLINKSQPQKKWDFLFEAAGPGCTYVMRDALAGAMKVRLCEHWHKAQQVGLHDWFAYAFARANGYKWVIDSQPSMLYRQHAENQVGVNEGWRAFRHRSRKILSGWGFQQSACIAEVVGIGDDPFVASWTKGGRKGLVKLAFQANHCRRKLRDRILFAISCLACCVGCGRK